MSVLHQFLHVWYFNEMKILEELWHVGHVHDLYKQFFYHFLKNLIKKTLTLEFVIAPKGQRYKSCVCAAHAYKNLGIDAQLS